MNINISPKNIVFTISGTGYSALLENKKLDLFYQWIEKKFKKNYLLVKENTDSKGNTVKDHLHCWIQEISIKKNSFTDLMKKEFPELKRKGKTGENKLRITYLKEEIQYYYLFKLDKSEITSNMIICENQRKINQQHYQSLKSTAELGEAAAFYRYCQSNVLPDHLSKPQKLVKPYIDYCVSVNKRRINYNDCENHVNYIVARTSPSTLEELWIHQMENKMNY